MPKNIKNINQKLFGMLMTQGYDPQPKSLDATTTPDIKEADVFQIVTKNGYPMTVTLDDSGTLKVYYDEDNGVDPNWTDPGGLSHSLMSFVRRHNLTDYDPEPQGLKKLKFDTAMRSSMKKEQNSLVAEGYYPMGKRASRNDGIPTVTIIIQHNRQLGEGEQRFRNVEKIFIENADGERFRSPTNSPALSKIFARSIAEGDKPHGEHWNHLVSLVEDYTKLRGFVRATKNGVFNENAQKWIEAGSSRYNELRESLKSLMTGRGYRSYFESWTPTLNEGSDDVGVDLTEMFKSSVLDTRVEAALPVIKRLSGSITEDKNLAMDLEEWAGQIERDAVYGVEDRAEGKLNEGCDCGPDCDCPDCEEHNPKGKKDVEEAELTPKQKKLDLNKNSKLDAQDFKMLRSKVDESVEIQRLPYMGDVEYQFVIVDPSGKRFPKAYETWASADKHRRMYNKKAKVIREPIPKPTSQPAIRPEPDDRFKFEKDVTEATGDEKFDNMMGGIIRGAPNDNKFNDMMGNITRGGAGLPKPEVVAGTNVYSVEDTIEVLKSNGFTNCSVQQIKDRNHKFYGNYAITCTTPYNIRLNIYTFQGSGNWVSQKSVMTALARAKGLAEGNSDVPRGNSKEVFKDDEIRVIQPLDIQSMNYYRQGTKWDLGLDPDLFKRYSELGPIYVVLPIKKRYPGERYLFQPASDVGVNEEDRFIDLAQLRNRFPQLAYLTKHSQTGHPDHVEEGYGEDPRGGRYGKIGKAKAVPVKPTAPTAPTVPSPTSKKPPMPSEVKESKIADDPLAAIRRLSGVKK